MSENHLIILNIALYLVSFMYHGKKYGILNLSSILFAMYLLSSVFSFLYYINPFFQLTFTADGTITLESILYLFTVNFLLCSSLKKFSIPNDFLLIRYNKQILSLFQKILVSVAIINFLFSLPGMIDVMHSNNLSDLRQETYESGSFGSKIFIISVLGRIFGACNSLLLFIALGNIIFFKEKKIINTFSIILYFLIILQTMLVNVSRGSLVFRIFEFFIFVLIFKDLLPVQLKKKVITISLIVVVSGMLFFSAITYSRFQEGKNSGAGLLASLRYAGEAQLNFAGLMYNNTTGITYGYRELVIFRRLLGLPYAGDEGISQQKTIDYLKKYNPNAPNYIVFYQLAGDYYLSFGKYGTLLIALLFNIYVSKYYKRIMLKRKIPYLSIYLAAFFCVYIGNGIFFTMYRNESGNFLFIFLILLSITFKQEKNVKKSISKLLNYA